MRTSSPVWRFQTDAQAFSSATTAKRSSGLNEAKAAPVEFSERSCAPESKLTAQVTLQNFGLSGAKSKITVRDGAKILASQDVSFKANGQLQTETLVFNCGPEIGAVVVVAHREADGHAGFAQGLDELQELLVVFGLAGFEDEVPVDDDGCGARF